MKKHGFTLAEVLITLGIIGVVAAITLPTLIKNYQKTVWVNQLKKAVSTVEQGFQKMMADDGVDKLSDTQLWGLINDEYSSIRDVTQHNAILKKYFKIIDTYDGEDAEDIGYSFDWDGEKGAPRYKCLDNINVCNLDSALRKLVMADGMIFGLSAFSSKQQDCIRNWDGSKDEICKDFVGNIEIDINGDKKPNQYGRDVFAFRLLDDGHLWSRVVSGDCYVSGDNYKDGFGCANRIEENGWKMDY